MDERTGPDIVAQYVGGPERTVVVVIDGKPYRYRGVGRSAFDEFERMRNKGRALAWLSKASKRGGGAGGEKIEESVVKQVKEGRQDAT